MMNEKDSIVLQENKYGNNILGDFIGGDSIANSLIGKIGSIANLSINTHPKYKITDKDLEKYKELIPEDKFHRFKNLVERIEFHIELQEYEKAKIFIEEASGIYHNHPLLLTLNGLCEYNSLDKSHVIQRPELLRKTILVFEKAREIDKDLAEFYGWDIAIAEHFKKTLDFYIEELKKMAPGYFRSRLHSQYYKAISKNLTHFESCYNIHNNIDYLKAYINHLSGYEEYAWFSIDSQGNEKDLGKNIFKNGAKGKLKELIIKVKEIERTYIPPEIQYGDYFHPPRRKVVVLQNQKRQTIAIIGLILIASILLFILYSTFMFSGWITLGLLGYTLLLWIIFHPFNQKISLAEMAGKWLTSKINK